MLFSFDELASFASRVRQAIDGLFVACHRPNRLPQRSSTDAAILERCDMLAAASDSSFWLVSAPEDVLSRYEAWFQDVETVDLQDVALSTRPRPT